MRIGIFDSGIGGLNVLDDFINNVKNVNYLYLGDNLNVPYGTKTKEQLEVILKRVFRYFEKEQVDMIFVACNTASAASKNLNCNIPVYRIIEPTCKKALEVNGNSNKKIALLATNFTIESKAYNEYLGDKVIGVKASAFVPICEAGLVNDEETFNIVAETLKDIKGKCDTIILGCTHFRLLEKVIKEYLGDVKIVDSSSCFTESLKKMIGNNQKEKIDSVPEIKFTKRDNINIDWFKHQYRGIDFINLE